MKNLFFTILLGISVNFSVNGQFFYERILVPSGGNFMLPGNTIKIHSYDIENDDMSIIQEFYGDFSNTILTDKQFSYVHIGRAASHPLGGDRIFKFDAVTGAVLDSSMNLPGVQKMLLRDNKLFITRGFGASENFFVVLDADNLSNILFEDTQIQNHTSGISDYANGVVISYTENNIGKLKTYNSIDYTSEVFDLDTISSGAGSILSGDGTIYFIFSEKFNPNTFALEYAAVTKFDFSSGTFESVLTPRANNAIHYNYMTNTLVGNFGTSNLFDTQTMSVAEVSTFGLPSYTAGIFLEELSQKYALTRTDFFSFGTLSIHNGITGIEEISTSTDISASALAVIGNVSPGKFLELLDINVNVDLGTVLEFDVEDLFYDFEEQALTYQVATEPVHHSATFNNSTLLLTIESTIEEIFAIKACDVWNRCATLDVKVSNYINSVAEMNTPSISVYPNPTQDYLYISGSNNQISVEIVDMKGRILKKQQLNNGQFIDIQDFNSGVYMLKIETSDNIFTEKIIKQ